MRKDWDWLQFFLMLAIGSISLLVIFSINRNLAINQSVFWIFGLFLMIFISQINTVTWQKLAIPSYAFSIISLVLLFFVADPIRGSVRWIDLGAFRFQPSEIAKVALILTLASFYYQKSARELKNVALSLLIALPLSALVLSQPDLGNAVSLMAIWFGITLVSGFQLKHAVVFILIAVVAGFTFFELLAPYQKARISSFINPNSDPLGTGYNIIQSKISVGSGMLFGRGLGRGTQSQLNFLPEAESDFIFASISEQLGFFGAGLLICFYFWLIARILRIANNVSRLGQIIIIGTVSFLLTQFLINIGMNMGLLPVTGITLPLVSYGGSSLISTLILIGIVSSIYKNPNY